ncbi:MAG: HpcH/HpaI aldolase/citrate lyase family protein [Hyphomicrobiales bacterium]
MSSMIRPRRSVLYMPGSNTRALEKAKTLDADAVILDLEDSVAPDGKADARALVCAAAAEGGYGRREVVIRVNGVDTPWGADDIAAAVKAAPDAILVPKASTAEDIERPAALLKGTDIQLWAMLETPLAMLNAKEIAATAENPDNKLACFVMGTNDLAKETGAHLTADRLPMLSWLSTCIAAARAYGVAIVDGVYNNFKDEGGFVAECEQGVSLGMDGKTLIHPAQISPCNKAFSPSEDEIAMARKIIAAFELPENQDKGVITIEGKMTERLHAEMARKTVAIADAIAVG